jgi:hypothetical protein
MIASPVKADLDQTFLSLGQKLSNLAMMSMLNKQDKNEPIDEEMVQTNRDDLDDNDIMAYSGINVDQDESAELESGGAIMDAIEHKDPSKSIPKKKPAKKSKKVVKKKDDDED